MQLSMKAKKFTFSDKFTVWDADGNDRYYVVGEMFSAGKRLHIKDTTGNEVASIREKIITLKPKFFIYVGEEQIGEIVKENTFFKSKYKVSGVDWVIKGDIDEHKYSIMKDKRAIVSVKKKLFSMTNSYVLDIEDDRDELPALAAVLAIDMVTTYNK